MIDYNATLKIFFNEVVKYLESLRKKAKDDVCANRITAAIDIVGRIAKDPKKYSSYSVRCKDGIENMDVGEAFIPAGTNDNRVFLSYSAVVNSMGDLNSPNDFQRAEAQKKLLNAMKSVKYRNSTSVLKDFTFPFKSAESFAVTRER